MNLRERFFQGGDLTGLTRDFLFKEAHLLAGCVVAALYSRDGLPACPFGGLVSLLPLPGLLSRAIDLLVSTVFNDANMRRLTFALHAQQGLVFV